MRGGQRVGGLGDHAGRVAGVERAVAEQVGNVGAVWPLCDDEGRLGAIVGIEDLAQPRIADPARGTGVFHDPRYVTGTRREHAHRHRAGQALSAARHSVEPSCSRSRAASRYRPASSVP